VNWNERAFLLLVLLVGAGVVLLSLSAFGVPIPYLSGSGDTDIGDLAWEDDLPPPLQPPDEEEGGLLAELDGGRDGDMRPLDAPDVLPASGVTGAPGSDVASGSADGSEAATPDGDPEKPATRDPAIDRLKASVDVKDNAELLGFLIGMMTEKGTKLSEEDLEFLLDALAKNEDYGVRNLLFTHLERIGGEGVTEGVLAFLEKEKNPAAVRLALGALRSQNDSAAVNGLVDFMEKTKNGRLREAAFKNLLATKNGSATVALLDILDHAENPSLKRYALAAVSQLGGAEGADAVLRYASSSDPLERGLGLKSLRDIKSPGAVPALTEAATRGTDNVLRTQSLRALARIRDASSIPAVSRIAAEDSNPGLRNEAVRTLASIGRADALPALRQIAQADRSAAVRRNAERAIVRIESVEARRAAKQRTR
jgi:HEAT repeat protein